MMTSPLFLQQDLEGIHAKFTSLEEKMQQTYRMTGIDYSDQSRNIEKVIANLCVLASYISDLPTDIVNALDDPLYKHFKNGATETLSRIRLEDFKTANDLGLKSYNQVRGHRYSINLRELNFDDFTGWSESVRKQDYVKGFSDLFKSDYELYKNQADTALSMDEYLKQLLNAGEFAHESYHPVTSFLSGLLDVLTLGIKPLIEACAGYDIITGEDLSQMERGLKALTGLTDLATVIVTVATLGTGTSAMVALRVVAVEAMANGTAYLTAEAAQAIGLPEGVVLVLSAAGGATVAIRGTKWIITNGAGKVIGEVPITSGTLAGRGKTWTSADRYVGETATAIDSKYPGKVKAVNKPVYRADGTPLTDYDIELDTAVIQVKQGSGKGATRQAENTASSTEKEVIVYLPDQSGRSAVVRGLKDKGFAVFTDEKSLLAYLGKKK
jgi:hypothetical protein